MTRVRMTDVEAREKLRYFLKWKDDVLNYTFGNGPYVPPFSANDSALFTKLISKYKYDKEFIDQLSLYSGKTSATSRSRRK